VELARIVLVLLDGAQKQIDLGNCNLGQGVGPGGAAGTGAGTRTQRTGVRGMGRVGEASVDGLGCWVRREGSRSGLRDHGSPGRRGGGGKGGTAIPWCRTEPLPLSTSWVGCDGSGSGNVHLGAGDGLAWAGAWERDDGRSGAACRRGGVQYAEADGQSCRSIDPYVWTRRSGRWITEALMDW
jgi:hypothetical protein